MATSGSTNFSQNCNQVVLDALAVLGVYGIGRTVSSEDMTFCTSMLNKMIKSFSAMGLHLWGKGEGILYLDQYVAKYSIGTAATNAYVTAASDEVITTLNGALTTSATAVTVRSTTGMTVGDYIGVVLSSKDIYWTTIATIPSATTLTLTAGLSAAASTGAFVYTFTARLEKPLRITNGRLVTGIDSGSTTSKTETILTPISYQQYQEMGNKTSNGLPNQFCYQPGTTTGLVYLWTRPSDTSYRFEFSYERLIEDLDTATDDFDFPAEWLEPITYQLAMRIGSAFGKDKKVAAVIGPFADALLKNLMDWDTEITSVSMQPDLGYN